MISCQRYISSIAFFFVVVSGVAQAKSLYVINDTYTSQLRAYEIAGTSLVYQTDYICESAPGGGAGSVGIAIDESYFGTFLFVTFEDTDYIEIVNAKSMQYVDTVTAPGAANLSGIAMDEGKSKVYTMDRYTNHLYSYTWYPSTKVLRPDFNDPYYIELPAFKYGQGKGAFGIALDEATRRLYIANNTNQIQCYNTDDWSKDPNIPVSCNVIGVAVDVGRQLLYYGSMGGYGQGDPNLYQYNLSTGNEQSVYLGDSIYGCSVAGIAVDQQTGLVYLTTYGDDGETYYPDPPADRLMIYDANLIKQPTGQTWESSDIGNPAGICVPIGEVEYKPPNLILSKTSDVTPGECNEPNDYITYTITYIANGHSDTNVVLIDYLPEGVTYVGMDAGDPPFAFCEYNQQQHVLVWDIGDVGPNDMDSIDIFVRVNNLAEPLGTIRNFCEMEGDSTYVNAEVSTPVCCWDPPVIYVDFDRWGGSNTGMSWKNAYLDLQYALNRASAGCGSDIWVAAGPYKPSIPEGQSATFQLVSGYPVYGGFAGNEYALEQRNLHDPNNETILTGYMDWQTNYLNVVSASNVNAATILDGFTITQGEQAGVNLTGGLPTIANCKIHHNNGAGISGNDANLGLNHCIISDNVGSGIYISNSKPVSITLTNNHIHNNQASGIYIYEYFYPGSSQITIRNNTITRNTGDDVYGISVSSNGQPNITNCIVWGNSAQITPSLNNVTYCCVQDGYYGTNNTSSDPCFINAIIDPNDYHLGPASVSCIDKGKTNSTEPNETDLDCEDRVMDGDYNNTFIVDIGADEYFWPKADFNRDGIVNFIDFAFFATAWQTGTGNPDYNDIYDLSDNNFIDCLDLAEFCDWWLWIAPWSDLYETQMSHAETDMGMASGEMASGESIGLMSLSADESQALQAEQPVFTEIRIEELIERFEQIWESDAEVREAITEADMQKFLDSLKEEL